MDILHEQLGIPKKYIRLLNGRISITVHRSWLANLLSVGSVTFITHDQLSADVIAAQPSLDELGSNWLRIYAQVYQKQHRNAIPLPRARNLGHGKTESELTFPQLLHYVMETNHHNLWKEAYKKYYSRWNPAEQREQSNITASSNDVAVMKDIITRMYGCPMVQLQDGNVVTVTPGSTRELHCNLLPALLTIETESCFITIHEQTAKYSLQDSVTYSPAALSSSHSKPLFLIYQLLRLLRDMHDRGLVLGEITLGDILLTDTFTIQVLPKITDNIHLKPQHECGSSASIHGHRKLKCHDYNKDISLNYEYSKNSGSPLFGINENIDKLCEMWIQGQISNFDYLTALNNVAGRRYGDPSCHHVMPWVTDFTSRCGGNWRDLTKSKFRLNKGDRQLDLTFDSHVTEVGHHVSDVLSEITYYVYLSRRYARSVLCKHVRPQWVPWEYPASIQRLHHWSPDECIPQFFTDPNVFKSIHEDLQDLEIPAWATSPEDFIEKHREALESIYVSERLHHWIDLTFGYKLSGSAAVKSKNVCLQLVDNHKGLTNSGIVQVFTLPHPQKLVPSPYWSKSPPRLQKPNLRERIKSDRSGERISEDEGHSSGFEEDESAANSNPSRSSPLALSRLLSRSRSSLLAPDDIPKTDKSSMQIILPKDYNPVAALVQVETTYAFLNKATHQTYKSNPIAHDSLTNYKQIVASSRIKEQQILGCLIAEIFLSARLRASTKAAYMTFNERFSACVNLLKASPDALPRCVRSAVALLLQADVIPKSYNFESVDNNDPASSSNNVQFRYLTVTNVGLPPPSAHQLLQSILSGSLFPFPKYFKRLFGVVEMLQEYNSLVQSLNLVTHRAQESESMSVTQTQYLCKISECKVKAAARDLERLLPEMGDTSEAYLELIVPHIRQIMEEPYCAVLAAWYLFDPIAKVIGPKHSAMALLEPIVKLYENGSIMDSESEIDVLSSMSPAKHRTVRLYHRSFLLKLMVRLGLRKFLDNFITPLVEAVGGYRDNLQNPSNVNYCRNGNLKTCDLGGSCSDAEAMLSPLDEDSSGDSDRNGSTSLGQSASDSKVLLSTDNEIEDVFVLETEENSPPSNASVPYNIDVHLELNLSLNDLSDEANKTSPPSSMKSPTIPIPKRVEGGKLVTGFNSIGCHVGSKTSSEDIPFSNSYVGNVTTGSNKATDSTSTTNVETLKEVTLHCENDDHPENVDVNDETVCMDLPLQKLVPIDCKVSEMSAESVIWLSHRLGPVLTARYLSRNLLRMLTLCYAGTENLTPISKNETARPDDQSKWPNTMLVGDRNASKVLECLTAIAGLYGEQIILLQYLGHMVELLALCKRKLTPNLEGGLVSCLALLTHIIGFLSDSALMDALHETILRSVLHPAVRILSTTRYTFPNGVVARSALADKYIAVTFCLSQRLGSEMSKTQIAVSIQRFFLAFDKAHGQISKNVYVGDIERKIVNSAKKINPNKKNSTTNSLAASCNESSYFEVLSDGSTQEWAVRELSPCMQQVQYSTSDEITESFSPPVIEDSCLTDSKRNKALDELRAVFTMELAHKSYVTFYRYIGDDAMEQILKNHQLIRDLCYEYEQETRPSCSNVDFAPVDFNSDTRDAESFGKISVVGNRIEVQRKSPSPQTQSSSDNGLSVSREMMSTSRHLRGNWLAYWEHEIGRPDKDTRFNIKQIKLQTFVGHTSSVRCLHVLDNENSFMSGGRDKSVKLWSLRSQGDGSAVSQCQYTYTGHKKSILALTFLESLRYAVTCDGSIHCWDPFMGSLLGSPECVRPAPVNTLAACPIPSTMLLAATTDMTLRVIDCRTFQYVNEMKVSMNPTGLIRCIAVAPSGHWIAMGQASGFLAILDIRTGLIIASWKGHECEVLQLEALNDTTIISSSLDQSIAVWSAVDGKLKFHLKGTTEPVHCLSIYDQELISATTANRIGVHTSVEATASFSSTKLRSDTFKGDLTAMSVLPLNRLLLLGADNGGISLLC
ncbi:WD repeat-containing protein 81 isoform X1 [Neodiprion virginianus]|uniref:WD repeat-containing protein 81 isoform X1 n=1 Tax=Neodiprion virginianus TaxID=2961670 RepID=UPI001EE6EAB0|nr:WD repeat-containing protein 81 isoform X1 [Neodiprion virginianus]